jgi:hypothetical protein
MQYFAWRVWSGLNRKIEVSFMLVGHTKFAPDWAFGLLKQRFKRSKVGCLDDLARVVNDSAKINHTQLVGREDGTIIVHQYDWANFFKDYFRRQAFDGIKALHHLTFRADKPGQVFVRKTSDGEEMTLNVLRKAHLQWKPSPHHLPPEIKPPGLSRERQEYLYQKIREFCPPETRDIVCPNPDATPLSSMGLSHPPQSPPPISSASSLSPSPKRRCH